MRKSFLDIVTIARRATLVAGVRAGCSLEAGNLELDPTSLHQVDCANNCINSKCYGKCQEDRLGKCHCRSPCLDYMCNLDWRQYTQARIAT